MSRGRARTAKLTDGYSPSNRLSSESDRPPQQLIAEKEKYSSPETLKVLAAEIVWGRSPLLPSRELKQGGHLP